MISQDFHTTSCLVAFSCLRSSYMRRGCYTIFLCNENMPYYRTRMAFWAEHSVVLYYILAVHAVVRSG